MPAAAVVGIGLAVGGTVASISAANKQRKAQQKQANYERQINQNRAAKERVQAIRAARLSAGAVTQAAEQRGASQSSGFFGGLGSIQSQLNTNLSFLDTQQRLGDAASVQAGRAANYAAQSAIWGGVSNLGKQVFSFAKGGGG